MPARPKLEKIHELISQKINIDMSKVNCIQPSLTKSRVIIELKSQAYVEELVSEHSLKHTIELNNQQYAIPLVPYDNAIEVKVADMPSYISTETIVKHLVPYGEVISLQDEKWKDFWPGLPTGVRLVRMRIKKPIPSYIPIGPYTAFVVYRNQIRTCRYCVRPLHIGRTCNEVRKEMGIDISSRLTAAQVVQGMLPPPLSSTTNDQTLSSMAVTEITDDTASKTSTNDLVPGIHRIIAAAGKSSSRPSSATRLPSGNSQVAGPSNINLPMETEPVDIPLSQTQESDFVISDSLSSDDSTNIIPPKRHRSPKSVTANDIPFEEVKRKSRSKTNNHSSSR